MGLLYVSISKASWGCYLYLLVMHCGNVICTSKKCIVGLLFASVSNALWDCYFYLLVMHFGTIVVYLSNAFWEYSCIS